MFIVRESGPGRKTASLFVVDEEGHGVLHWFHAVVIEFEDL